MGKTNNSLIHVFQFFTDMRITLTFPKKKIQRAAKRFIILVVVLFPIWISFLVSVYYQALNLNSDGDVLPGLDYVRYLDVHPGNVTAETDGTRCLTNCFYWNPSIIQFHGKVYFAVRESSQVRHAFIFRVFAMEDSCQH